MPQSPLNASDGVLCITASIDGQAIAQDIALLEVRVRHAVAGIATAQIVVQDCDMPSGLWSVADGETFKPGAAVVLRAGYGDPADTGVVFEGIVVKIGIRIGADNGSRLEVQCQGHAVKMTRARKNKHFVGQTDGAIITRLLGEHGLTALVDTTVHSHGGLTQYGCTDWDFINARAAANGLVVIATGAAVHVQAPRVSDTPPLEVTWGQDLMEFHAEADTPGAGLPGPAGAERVRGRMKFQGSAAAQVGTVIRVKGLAKRFCNDFFVAAVEHDIADGNWFSTIEFESPAQACGVHALAAAGGAAPAVAGASAGTPGLQLGTVVQIDGDPAGEQRIRVELPLLAGGTDRVWARVLQLHASNGFGALFMPEVGDEVVVDFFQHDPSQPVVLGSLYSSHHPPAHALAPANDIKALVTRSQHRLEFDEKNKAITVTTPARNKVVLSDQDESILLHDQHGNKLELRRQGISLDTPKDLRISAKGTISIDAVGALNLHSSSDVAVNGLNVSCKAQVGFSGKGSATAELSADGQTTIKGALVMIN